MGRGYAIEGIGQKGCRPWEYGALELKQAWEKALQRSRSLDKGLLNSF